MFLLFTWGVYGPHLCVCLYLRACMVYTVEASVLVDGPENENCFIHFLFLLPSVSPSTGFLRDRLGSYEVAFYLAGIPPIIGGAVLCTIPWVEARRKRREKEAAADAKIPSYNKNSENLEHDSVI